jgi:hypothetical protein
MKSTEIDRSEPQSNQAQDDSYNILELAPEEMTMVGGGVVSNGHLEPMRIR